MCFLLIGFVENKNELKFDVENLYRQYSTETSATTEVIDQTTMDSKLNELYEEKIEKNIIQKILTKNKSLYIIINHKVKQNLKNKFNEKESNIN